MQNEPQLSADMEKIRVSLARCSTSDPREVGTFFISMRERYPGQLPIDHIPEIISILKNIYKEESKHD